MKAIIISVSTIMAALTTILIAGFRKYDEPITLSVPSCGIEVNCEYVVNPTSERLQTVIDKAGVAAWHNSYIMDHAGQSFNGLWNMKVGEEIVFGTRHYKCSFITTGWSDRGIEAHNRNEKLPDADLYLCTCVPGGEEFEIYIVGLEREQ